MVIRREGMIFMAQSQTNISNEIHPIDVVENLAEYNKWDFDRIADDQIAMIVEGQWRSYSITLAWSPYDETLRMICSFEMDPPSEKMSYLYEMLNLINDQCWTGSFTFWDKQDLMVFRYGLVLSGGQFANQEQVETLISNAVSASERYYPALQLMLYGGQSPAKAIKMAIAEAYGRA
tara:strand:+ start:27 stop:557 length:531 start_codon:yes stop_codon:yes gene_type:complete